MVEKLNEITTHVLALSDDEIGTILAALSDCGDDDIYADLFDAVYGGDDDCGCGCEAQQDIQMESQETASLMEYYKSIEGVAQESLKKAKLAFDVDTSSLKDSLDIARELTEELEKIERVVSRNVKYERVGENVYVSFGGCE